MPEILKQNKTANHRKAVVFCADRNVVRFAQFVADQIMKSEPDRDYDICITTFDPQLVELDRIDPEIRICQVDETPFASLRSNQRVTSTAYILLALPEIFALEYDKIVYLDTDVFLRGGKISDLFDAAVKGFAVSGILDSAQWSGTPSTRQIDYWRALNLIDKPYLNTGVLVLDVEKCISEGFYAGSLQAAQKLGRLKKDNPMVLFLHDQSAINMHLMGNWAPISLRWNWQAFYETAQLVKRFDPLIMHFVSNTKPWIKKTESATRGFLPEYKVFFRDVLGEELLLKNYQTQRTLDGMSPVQWLRSEFTFQKIASWINVINPFYYTRLRGLLPVYLQYKNVQKIEAAIKADKPIWPRNKMIAALK